MFHFGTKEQDGALLKYYYGFECEDQMKLIWCVELTPLCNKRN